MHSPVLPCRAPWSASPLRPLRLPPTRRPDRPACPAADRQADRQTDASSRLQRGWPARLVLVLVLVRQSILSSFVSFSAVLLLVRLTPTPVDDARIDPRTSNVHENEASFYSSLFFFGLFTRTGRGNRRCPPSVYPQKRQRGNGRSSQKEKRDETTEKKKGDNERKQNAKKGPLV